MNGINPAMRLIDHDEIGDASVSQLLQDLGAIDHEQVAIGITDSHGFTPCAAFIVMHGQHTPRFLDAIEAVRKEIQKEQTERTAS